MIEATCTTCGTINRIADTDVPVGAKFVSCASCKSRVALPVAKAAAPKIPAIPPRSAAPAAARPGSLELDELLPGPSTGIVDLPAPKTGSSATSGAVAVPRALATSPGIIDLPAPKGMAPRAATPPSAHDGVIDLPAPKGAARSPSTVEPAKAGKALDAIVDLPAPKSPSVKTALPPLGIVDLPGPRGISDLPAPKPKASPLADLPAPKATPRPSVLPPKPATPVRPPSLGPAGATMKGPASPTKAPASIGAPLELDLDLELSPGASREAAIDDLPMPKGREGDLDLPELDEPGLLTPRGELPAPKGFFDDLPEPARTRAAPAAPSGFFDDLPDLAAGKQDLAPKGFFDDLPQPAAGKQDLAPKGFFDDLPQPAASKDLAPKGFFDDLPEPATGKPTDLAPKGFFDDLPGRVNPSKPQAPAVPAPKGFFDDLPGRVNPSKPAVPAPKGFFDDLPQPTQKRREDPEHELSQSAIELLPEPDADDGLEARATATDPALPPDDGGTDLDLSEPTGAQPPPTPTNKFDDLDLSEPTAAPIRFDAPKRTSAPAGPAPKLDSLPSTLGDNAVLELEGESAAAPGSPLDKPVAKKQARATAAPAAKKPAMSARKKRIVAIATAGALALGAGGFVLYQRRAAAQERQDQISQHLHTARTAMTAPDAAHWTRAASAASKVLELDDAQPEALGIAAEAMLASALADGRNVQLNISRAQKHLAKAVDTQARHASIERAQALSPLAANRAEAALPKLEVQLKKAPGDPALSLYTGWAQAMRNDFAAAVTSFDAAAKAEPTKAAALYGRARAKLALGDVAGARTDFAAVLDVVKDHVAAQVGLAASLPAAQAQQQEADLLALLQRKDLDAADPRAVVDAWVLVAGAAQRGGRLDAARERYRKAIDAAKPIPVALAADVPAMTGLAEVELRDGNAKVAYDWITKATTSAKDDVRAQLVAAEIEIVLAKLDSATARIQALTNRNPPPPMLEQARLKLVAGRLLEAKGEHGKAAEAFVDAAALAGDLDLTPALAAVAKFGAMANEATAARDPARADELKGRADKLLAGIAKNAEKDLQLALTLGTSYLSTDDATKAEPWLRRYVEARPADAEGQYQLSKALAKLGKFEDAIERLRKAVEIDPARVEIGLELARTYEAAGRDSDAVQLYTRLVALRDVGVEVRARAGRFFARTGQLEKAAEQGEKILAVDAKHPAGLYLKAEGQLARGETTAARTTFTAALAGDANDPQFLDGQGRAAEADAIRTGDSALQDVALRAYMAAAVSAPRMLNPWIGQGRLYVARKEFRKSLDPLLKGVELAPNHGEIAFLMGVAYQELQQQKVAIQWLQKANSVAPRAEAYWRLGAMYRDANNGGAAASALSSATSLAIAEEKKTGKTPPWLVDALYDLGSIYKDMNNDAGARAAWEQYVGRNPPPSSRLTAVKQALDTTLRRQ